MFAIWQLFRLRRKTLYCLCRFSSCYKIILHLKAEINRKYRLVHTRPVMHTSPFVNSRSIFSRVKLVKGRYCIIPSSFEPGHQGRYLLRVYSSSDIDFRYYSSIKNPFDSRSCTLDVTNGELLFNLLCFDLGMKTSEIGMIVN